MKKNEMQLKESFNFNLSYNLIMKSNIKNSTLTLKYWILTKIMKFKGTISRSYISFKISEYL